MSGRIKRPERFSECHYGTHRPRGSEERLRTPTTASTDLKHFQVSPRRWPHNGDKMNYTKMMNDCRTAPEMVTNELRTKFQKDYLVRYYPKTKDRHTNHLVGIKRMAEIVADPDVFANILGRVERNLDDRIEICLRRGIRFVFIRH